MGQSCCATTGSVRSAARARPQRRGQTIRSPAIAYHSPVDLIFKPSTSATPCPRGDVRGLRSSVSRPRWRRHWRQATILASASPPRTSPSAGPTAAHVCRWQPARPSPLCLFRRRPRRAPTTCASDGPQGNCAARRASWRKRETFPLEPRLSDHDVDTAVLGERMRMQTFNDMGRGCRVPRRRSASAFEHRASFADIGCPSDPPVSLCPNRRTHLDQDCYEAFNVQVEGLRRGFEATSGTHMVIGVSGGLDSTHALIVAAKVCDRSACRAARSSASPCRLRHRGDDQGETRRS